MPSNQLGIVSETLNSCDTVCHDLYCRELYFARCCALKRTGTFASESNVMCLF